MVVPLEATRYFSQIHPEVHSRTDRPAIPETETPRPMNPSPADPPESEDAFEDFAELYELTHRGKDDDLELYLGAASDVEAPILEIGCGTGRVAFALANAGHEVVGVDLSSSMLAIARRKLDELAPDVRDRVRLEQQDMVKLDLGSSRFPLVLMPFAELAHLPDRKQHEETLARIHRHLEPGGTLILSMSNWDARETRIHYEPTRRTGFGPSMPLTFEGIFEDRDGDRLIHRYLARGYDPSRQMALHAYVHEITDRDGRMIAKKTHLIPIRYIFRFEMELLLENAGFEIEALHGYYDRSPFRHDSRRMIFVARKPAS